MNDKIRSRVLVVAHDSLFPANHGYRIDVARRMQRLLDLGCEVGLICLSRQSETSMVPPADADRLSFCRCFGVESYTNPWLAQLQHIATPWPITARVLKTDVLESLLKQVAEFAPDKLLLEGLYSIELAQGIIASLPGDLPLIYRSHNIEYQYMRGQLKAASGLRSRVNLALSVKGLEEMERRTLAAAELVLDISWEDSRYWSKFYGDKVLCLPPLPRAAVALPGRSTCWDVAYCGNLNAPNNVEAIAWFVNDVWPQIQLRHGCEMRLVLAGSNPTAEVESLVRAANGVEIVANPDSMDDIYAQVKVLINPALRGSGVNIKTIDMISVGKPMVLSSAAVAGLPPAITKELRVAKSKQEWIAAFDEELFAAASVDTKILAAYSSLCDEAYKSIFSTGAGEPAVSAA